jgi:hypothetical protein
MHDAVAGAFLAVFGRLEFAMHSHQDRWRVRLRLIYSRLPQVFDPLYSTLKEKSLLTVRDSRTLHLEIAPQPVLSSAFYVRLAGRICGVCYPNYLWSSGNRIAMPAATTAP